jgi:hypothetical protein
MIGDKGVLIDGRLLKPDDRIYDLVDVVRDSGASDNLSDQENAAKDGKVNETVSSTKDRVVDLTDAVEEGYHDDVIMKVSEIAERVAREMIPDIAERIIREEIEKLKG